MQKYIFIKHKQRKEKKNFEYTFHLAVYLIKEPAVSLSYSGFFIFSYPPLGVRGSFFRGQGFLYSETEYSDLIVNGAKQAYQ